jgi:tRNA(Ile)-lysidine synthase
MEEIARDCRYYELHAAMMASGATQIAMGHHLDDQVETMVMRFQKGTRTSGLAGMRNCRRWGMGTGERGALTTYGYEGMNSWIVRPLLPFPKV